MKKLYANSERMLHVLCRDTVMRIAFWWVICTGIGVVSIVSCAEAPVPTPKSITYGFELEKCTETSKTCAESIACENDARARYNRPLRDPAKGCK